jgi:outer membrane protein assembly factor BamB
VKLRRALPAGVLALCSILLLAACGPTADPEGWAAPVFDGDTVYVFLDDDHLSAVQLDDNSGVILWTFPDDNLTSEEEVELKGVYTEPIVDGDFIYFGAYDGEVYAVGRADGRLRWTTEGQLNIKGSIVGGPVLVDASLIFGTTDGHVYRVQASDGAPFPGWPQAGISLSKKGIWAPPVVQGGTVYVATMAGEVHALELATANQVWAEPFEGDRGAIADLASLDGAGPLFVPTLGRHVYLLDPATGQSVGAGAAATHWVWTRPAVSGSVAYYGDFAGELFAIDITNATIAWTAATDGRVKGGPAVVGDYVVFVDESPAVIFVNRESGEVRNRVALQDAGRIRAGATARDGIAYVVSTNGKLFRADPGNFSVSEIPIAGLNE